MGDLDKLAVKGNFLERLARLERKLERLERREITAKELSEISSDLGAHSAGRLTSLDASGNAQVLIDLDNQQINYAGGDMMLDANGQHSTRLGYIFDMMATSEDGSNPRRASMEMFLNSLGVPAARIVFGDNTDATELVTNGDFGTGTSGWTATLTGASTFDVLTDFTQKWGHLQRAFGQSGSVSSSSGMSVTAGKHYRARLRAWGAAADSVTLTGRVDWFDGAAALISSSTVLSAKKTMTGGYATINKMEINTSVEAPIGAVTAKYYFTVSSGGHLYFTDVSLQLLGVSQELVFDDNGLSVLKWSGSITDGVNQNFNTGSSWQRQTMVLQAWKPIRITGFNWDIRQTGDYELWLLYAPGLVIEMRKLWNGNVSAAGTVNITLPKPLVLLPGEHYLSLYRPAGNVTWWDYNDTSYLGGGGVDDPPFKINGMYYNTTSTARIPGVRLVYQIGEWS